MAKCSLDIKLDIIDTAREQAIQLGGFRQAISQNDALEITDSRQAAISAREVNNQFKEDIITPSFVSKTHYIISPSDKLVSIYFDKYKSLLEDEARQLQTEEMERGGYTEEQRGEFFQKKEAPASKASPKTVQAVKDFLSRIGVGIQTLQNITINGVKQDVNGAAFIVQKLVQVVDGKEATVLPEEAMHFAVEIIQQTDPKLFNQLLKEINGYQTLQDVFKTYGSDSNYQLDGKPDVIKLKKEAIAKVLAETVIKQTEGVTERPELLAKVESWWQSIITAIRNLFAKSGFDTAAIKVLSGEAIGTVDDIRTAREEEVYLQKGTQESIYNRMIDIRNGVEQRADGFYANDKKVPRRVSDIIRSWYERRFEGKEILKSEYEKAIDDLKAKKGIGGHADMNYAFELFVNKDGFLRDFPLDDRDYTSQLDPNDNEAYYILRNNMKARLESFPVGTRFMSNLVVYDAKRGVADKIDFVAITPEGKVSILDWKFMDIDPEKSEGDIPWYKVGAFRQEMDQYKLILQNAYDIKPEDFEQVRTIPIRTAYVKAPAGSKDPLALDFIEIGDVKIDNIKRDYLIPVGVESEKTGVKKIDALLEKLNAVYKRLSETKVLPSERLDKNEQLNKLFSAIRQLQMKQNLKPLLYQAKVLNNQLQGVIDKYNSQFKGKDPKSFTDKQINEFAAEIISAENTINAYTTLDTDLKFLFTGKTLTDEDKELREDLRDTVDNARDLQSTLREVADEYVNDIIAGSEDVDDILSPEKIIKGISKLFSSTSTLQIKALEVLYKKANKAFAYAGFDTLEETKNLQALKAEYDKLAQSKGWTVKNYFDIIKKKDKNELIDQYNPEFYSELRAKVAAKDIAWIKANIDIDAYKEHVKNLIEEEEQRLRDRAIYEVGTPAEIEGKIDQQIQFYKRLYNTIGTGAGWFQYEDIKKFPADKWESNEWKELTKTGNEAALEFYKYIQKKNKEYHELGYIGGKEARTFLPYVRKGLVEKLIFGGKISLGEQFMRSISIDEGDVGYGQIDPLTGRPIDKIPIYFTQAIEGDISTDLFRTMALYNEMAIRYKYLSDIEEQAQSLIEVERNKKAIATSYFGKTVYKDGKIQYTPDNNENTKLVEDMVKGIIYGQRYLQSESFDQVLGTLGDFGERVNKKLGFKLLPEGLSGRQISVNKSITQLNNFFQTKTLGLNLLSATSNMFGGTAQSIINSGKYFTKSDYASTEGWLMLNKMNGKDKQLAIAALEYFLPLTENYNKEIAKHLSLSKLSQENIQEALMVLMRNTDLHVQTVNFFSYLNNSFVENGEVLNAREYLKSQPKYANYYEGTPEERKKLDDEFEKDVKQLVEDKGVMKLGSVVDGKFEIPGVERKSASVVELRRKVQQLSKDALGNLSDDDLRMINMNIYGKSFMMFKNWIPRLVDVRAGNLKYNSASDAYEWGRMRNVFRIISEDALHSLSNLKNSLQANEEGVEFMKTLYEKKKADYEKETGKTLEMTEREFMDLVRGNLKSQMVDTIFFMTMIALVWGLKANAPDDDENPAVKNQYKFLMKAADKLKDEITYFYDPTSFSNLVSTGIFPSVGMIDNMKTLLVNFMKENYGLAVGDEKLVKKTYVIKYLLKTFPVTSQSTQFLPMFFPDLAKDLGIKAQSQSGFIK